MECGRFRKGGKGSPAGKTRKKLAGRSAFAREKSFPEKWPQAFMGALKTKPAVKSARKSKAPPPTVIVLPPNALKTLDHPDQPDTGESYFSFRDVHYVSTIGLAAIEAGPTWNPSLPLPFPHDRAAIAARALLRRIVKDDTAWTLNEITLQRVRNVEPERWFSLSSSPARRAHSIFRAALRFMSLSRGALGL